MSDSASTRKRAGSSARWRRGGRARLDGRAAASAPAPGEVAERKRVGTRGRRLRRAGVLVMLAATAVAAVGGTALERDYPWTPFGMVDRAWWLEAVLLGGWLLIAVGVTDGRVARRGLAAVTPLFEHAPRLRRAGADAASLVWTGLGSVVAVLPLIPLGSVVAYPFEGSRYFDGEPAPITAAVLWLTGRTLLFGLLGLAAGAVLLGALVTGRWAVLRAGGAAGDPSRRDELFIWDMLAAAVGIIAGAVGLALASSAMAGGTAAALAVTGSALLLAGSVIYATIRAWRLGLRPWGTAADSLGEVGPGGWLVALVPAVAAVAIAWGLARVVAGAWS